MIASVQDGRVKAGREAELSSGQNRSAEPVRWQQVLVMVMMMVMMVVVEVMTGAGGGSGRRRRRFSGHHDPRQGASNTVFLSFPSSARPLPVQWMLLLGMHFGTTIR